jgi:hypothetical protein
MIGHQTILLGMLQTVDLDPLPMLSLTGGAPEASLFKHTKQLKVYQFLDAMR